MSNLNLKIEYVDGKLVALERNGVSFINTDVTGIFFQPYAQDDTTVKY